VDITETIVDQVANRAVALGFVEGPCHQPGLEVERFRPDELVVVCAPEHRWATLPSISLSELSEERVILRTAGGTRDVVDRTLARHGLALRPNIEFGHTEAIKTAVERGQGVSILSRVTCAQELRAGVLAETRLAGVRFARWLYRVSLAGRRANPLVASFLAHLEAQLEIVYPTADWDDAE
jgi:DNA-binding transcriptional LysR family regulator